MKRNHTALSSIIAMMAIFLFSSFGDVMAQSPKQKEPAASKINITEEQKPPARNVLPSPPMPAADKKEPAAAPAPAPPQAKGPAGTSPVEISNPGALSYQLPANYSGTFETSIDKLTLKNEELPESLTLASVAKMKTNPQLSTTKKDFDKIAKEAFRNKIATANWRIAHTSFYKGKDATDDTLYIIIAVEYKKDVTPDSLKKDCEELKKYLKRETSDEYVILEKFPFLVVVGANQNGEFEFSSVKELSTRLKTKLFGAASVESKPVVYSPPAVAPEKPQSSGEVEIKAAPKNAAPVKVAPAKTPKNEVPEKNPETQDDED